MGRLQLVLKISCALSALVVTALPVAGWGAEGMELQVRRTGPPLKIVREARGPEYIVLRGEMKVRAEEAKKAPRVTRTEVSPSKTQPATKTLTRVGANRRPARLPASLPKKVARKARPTRLASTD